MQFRFDVFLTDEDYLDLNDFMLLNNEKNDNTYKRLRIFTIITFLVVAAVGVFNTGSVLFPAMLLPFGIACVVFVKPFCIMVTKRQIRENLKKDKKLYSPQSIIEFYDEWFSESTPEDMSHYKYSAVERICVSEKGAVYLFINQIRAYIIPRQAFHSADEFNCFMNFMHTKCADIKFYN